MTDKCTKFEGLFVFSNQEFDSHLESCEDCRLEKEKFDKISALIKEAKPLYFSQKKSFAKKTATVAVASLLLIAGSLFTTMNYNSGMTNVAEYGDVMCAEDLGFPVDSWGLILVDE